MVRYIAMVGLGLVVAQALSCTPESKPTGPPPFADLVAEFGQDLALNVEIAAAERAGRVGVHQVLSEPSRRDELKLGAADLVARLYDTRKSAPIWVDPKPAVAALNAEGESLYAALLDAEPVHGLWLEDYHLDTIAVLLARAGDKDLRPVAAMTLTAQETSTLSALLVQHPQYAKDPESVAQAIGDGDLPMPRIKGAIDRRVEAIGVIAATKAKLDVLLTDAVIAYGIHMRWGNQANWGDVWPEALARAQDGSALSKAELNGRRRDRVVLQALEPVFLEPNMVHSLLATIPPAFPQYHALTEAFQRYTALAEVGWSEVPRDVQKLRVGHRGPHVVALKERMAAEGYWSQDEQSDRFSRDFRTAVREYQESHQLWPEGWVTPETWRSLNVPAARRRDQLRVTLDRWRESRVGDDNIYVHVNIPDFHAEVWRGGERKMRFKVVTGSSARKWNQEKKVNEYPHATPRISGELEHVVFNPFWNVPKKILQSEIEPKMAENPLYMVENGYEWATDDFGQQYVRQRPGSNNALGAVKFMFPNPHHVFLHDTSEPARFRPPVRAFSHGCVRVENPMDLAKFLLSEEGKWDDEEVASWMARDTETWIKLDRKIPVHIEYFVTRVDGLGRANFLADIYRLDTPRVAQVRARLDARNKREAAKRSKPLEQTPASIRD